MSGLNTPIKFLEEYKKENMCAIITILNIIIFYFILKLAGMISDDKVKPDNVRTGCVKDWRGERERTWKSVNVRCRQGALCSLNFTAKSSASDGREPRQGVTV